MTSTGPERRMPRPMRRPVSPALLLPADDASEAIGRLVAAAIQAAEAPPPSGPLGPECGPDGEDDAVEGSERTRRSGPAERDAAGAANAATPQASIAAAAAESLRGPMEADAGAISAGPSGGAVDDAMGLAPSPSWSATGADGCDPLWGRLAPPGGAGMHAADGRDGRPQMMRSIHPAEPTRCALTELVRGGDGTWWL